MELTVNGGKLKINCITLTSEQNLKSKCSASYTILGSEVVDFNFICFQKGIVFHKVFVLKFIGKILFEVVGKINFGKRCEERFFVF